jgi:hypothetical protein
MYLQKVKSKKTLEKNIFCWSHWWKEKDPEPEPDPLVRGTDPWIRFPTKMSQIRNTGSSESVRHGVQVDSKKSRLLDSYQCGPFYFWPYSTFIVLIRINLFV